MKTSVVIPTYNEQKRIEKTVNAIWRFLGEKDHSFEIIVSDDGSNDGTCEVVKKLRPKFHNLILLENKHSGKGMTLITGMKAAKGEIVLFTDADLATPITEFEKFLPKFGAGNDVVIGSRGFKREKAPPLRLIMSWVFNFFVRLFLPLNFSDTNCGFKAFKKKALEKILPRLKLYTSQKEIKGSRVSASFDLELLFIAKKQKFKIAEVPVLWHHQASKAVRPITESLLAFLDILKIRFYDFLGVYR